MEETLTVILDYSIFTSAISPSSMPRQPFLGARLSGGNIN